MKPPPFGYHEPATLDEAVALLAELGDDAKVLAGGQSLIPLLSLRLARPAELVDINRVEELAYIRNGDGLEIGALTRQRAVERSDLARSTAPLLIDAVRMIGHPAIRTRGTIGGSIAHADPAAELPAVLTVLDGEVVARSASGTRTIDAASFFEGFLSTTLQPDELVTAVRFPSWPASTGWSFLEFSRRSGDFAVVGAATTLTLSSDGRLARARIALSGVAGAPVRAAGAEDLLTGETPSPDLWEAAGASAAASVDPPDDLHGTAVYRHHLVGVLVRRSLAQAYGRAVAGEAP